MKHQTAARARYVMVVDLDRCTGCGNCMVACAVENNVPMTPAAALENRSLTWMKVYRVNNGQPYPGQKTVCIPIPCQHCDTAPCAHVCPVNAVQRDDETGIIGQIPERCMGCRYCMAACPYHARYFNWFDPIWPEGMEQTLNPDVSPRMRGVAEKCNFCHGRLDRAREKAAAEGRRVLAPGEYVPACAEACPTGAIRFGNALDPDDEVSELIKRPEAFRLLENLKTETKVYYLSRHPWVRRIGLSRLDMVRGNGTPDRGAHTHG